MEVVHQPPLTSKMLLVHQFLTSTKVEGKNLKTFTYCDSKVNSSAFLEGIRYKPRYKYNKLSFFTTFLYGLDS